MSRHASFFLGDPLAFVFFLRNIEKTSSFYNLPDPYECQPAESVIDTIPPISSGYANWVEYPNANPFDLLDPEEVIQDVEYDPVTNRYILTERIGNEYFRSPTTMTYEEYLEWRSNKEEQEYFKKLAGASSGERGSSGNLDPVA